MTVSDTE